MSLRLTLTTEMKNAMKARDQVKLDTVRFVLSQIKNAEIDLHREMTDEEIINLMKKEVKNRKEAIDQFKQGGRMDLVDEEEAKLVIIQQFLPAEMSDEELEKIVQQVVDAAEDKSFGSVMKVAMTELKGKADGSRISAAVKKLLG